MRNMSDILNAGKLAKKQMCTARGKINTVCTVSVTGGGGSLITCSLQLICGVIFGSGIRGGCGGIVFGTIFKALNTNSTSIYVDVHASFAQKKISHFHAMVR